MKLPKVVGKIYIKPLTKEQERIIRVNTNIIKLYDKNKHIGHYHFTIPKDIMSNLTPEDIMLYNGYNPAGYGRAFNRKESTGLEGATVLITFRCLGSCE